MLHGRGNVMALLYFNRIAVISIQAGMSLMWRDTSASKKKKKKTNKMLSDFVTEPRKSSQFIRMRLKQSQLTATFSENLNYNTTFAPGPLAFTWHLDIFLFQISRGYVSLEQKKQKTKVTHSRN